MLVASCLCPYVKNFGKANRQNLRHAEGENGLTDVHAVRQDAARNAVTSAAPATHTRDNGGGGGDGDDDERESECERVFAVKTKQKSMHSTPQ